ncbi:MAG: hypothetical protein RL186_2 [Pseudomonadota bacterium]
MNCKGCHFVAPLRGGFAILDSPRQTARSSDFSAGLSKRVKAAEREARALTRLVKPMTIETGLCVSGTITKGRPRPLALLRQAPSHWALTCVNPSSQLWRARSAPLACPPQFTTTPLGGPSLMAEKPLKMSSSAVGRAVMETVSPSLIAPDRISRAKGSCRCFWITRLSGRAP